MLVRRRFSVILNEFRETPQRKQLGQRSRALRTVTSPARQRIAVKRTMCESQREPYSRVGGNHRIVWELWSDAVGLSVRSNE